MKKGLLLLFSLVIFARENPFSPVVKINNPSPIEDIKEFKKIAFNVPSDARILNKIKLIYTNIDGTLKEYELEVNQGLDWHKVYMMLDARELSFSETESKQELGVEDKLKAALIKEEDKEITKEEDKNIQANVNQAKQEKKLLEYVLSDGFKVVLDDKITYIKTNSRLLREFNLKKPNRIVLDFNLKSGFKNKNYKLNTNYINEIYTGVHRNFYRLVIKLDGIYDYDVSPSVNGYVIELK